MKQVLQFVDSGATRVQQLPAPVCGPQEVLVANSASLISAGTEKAVIELARRSLLGKARERPDQVRRVLQKLRQEGVMDTLRQVRARLQQPIALGYSSAGVVLEVGRDVRRFSPGDRVATAGAHAEIVVVPQTLVAAVPAPVGFDEACYATVGAVALNGLRLGHTGLGDRVAVIGLGLIGQIAVQLARASGSRVLATDVDASRLELGAALGAETVPPDAFSRLVEHATEGYGADSVLITASGSDSRALQLAAAIARKRARIVAVGAIGMDVPRRDFYPKELELVVACSYGPGRYDPHYEDGGADYPYPYVRWTEQRNLEAVLEQIAAGRLDVRRLTTHRFAVDQADKAYELISGGLEPHLGVVLTYPGETSDRSRRVTLSAARRSPQSGTIGVGLVGAGVYGSSVLAPGLVRIPGVRPRVICSAGGVSAAIVGDRLGFEAATTTFEEVIADPDVHAVFIATPHHLHAAQALQALRAGKHVFIEKPLAITFEQLSAFHTGVAQLGPEAPLWMVGFNRRFAEPARAVFDAFETCPAPLTLTYRFNAGPLDRDHWLHDPDVGGGRLIGEACHALDLAAYLLRGRIVRVFAEAPTASGKQPGGDDQALIVARFDNGSVATISYVSGGTKAFAKERVEVFGGERIAVIDDFRTVSIVADGQTKQRTFGTREKGHREALETFVAAIRAGSPLPVTAAATVNVSAAAIAIVESLQTGGPVEVGF